MKIECRCGWWSETDKVTLKEHGKRDHCTVANMGPRFIVQDLILDTLNNPQAYCECGACIGLSEPHNEGCTK